MTPETYSIYSNAGWKAAAIPIAAEHLRAHLAANLTGHKTWRTADLFASLDVQPEQARTMTNALYKIRKSGLVDDCFRRDLTKRHMGSPLICWLSPLRQPDTSPETSDNGTVQVNVSPEDF